MNRPDKAGEPSMEEILASIRQIIADEPQNDRPVPPVVETNSLAPKSPAVASEDRSEAPTSSTTDARPPQLDRLSGALKNGPVPPTSPLGSKRPLSFDQDLADMFDEGDATNGAAQAPKPDVRVPFELSHPMATKSFVPSPAKPAVDEALVSPSQPVPSQPVVTPQPLGSADGGAAAPPRPSTFGFPPLRKQGFFPPQPPAPVLPPLPAADSVRDETAAASPSPSGAPVSIGLDEALKRISGFGAVVPGKEAGPLDAPAPSPLLFGAPSSSMGAGADAPPSSSNGARGPDLSFDAPKFSPAAPAATPSTPSAFEPSLSTPSLATPAAYRSGLSESVAETRPLSAAPSFRGPEADKRAIAESTTVASFEDLPVEPRPFGAAPPQTSPVASASRFEPQSAPSPAAAHPALDALAQGLAASAAASAVSAAIAQPAIPLTPVVDRPEQGSRDLPEPVTLPAPAASAPAPGRTLEDAVADMLRPMLQQWVSENMPRIIEKALRVEVATTIKPGQKPPGT